MAAASSAGGRGQSSGWGTLRGSWGRAARKGEEKGVRSFLLAPGRSSGAAGEFSTRGPLQSQSASRRPAPGPLPTRAAARGPTPGLPEPPAGHQRASGGSRSGGAVQPLRPAASGRRDRGCSGQARATIPDSTGLEVLGLRLALQTLPSLEGIVRAWTENETKAHHQWVKLQLLPSTASIKKKIVK